MGAVVEIGITTAPFVAKNKYRRSMCFCSGYPS